MQRLPAINTENTKRTNTTHIFSLSKHPRWQPWIVKRCTPHSKFDLKGLENRLAYSERNILFLWIRGRVKVVWPGYLFEQKSAGNCRKVVTAGGCNSSLVTASYDCHVTVEENGNQREMNILVVFLKSPECENTWRIVEKTYSKVIFCTIYDNCNLVSISEAPRLGWKGYQIRKL